MTATTQARLPEDVMELEVRVSEDAAALVERMSDELALWSTEVEAGLFLAGLALAHGTGPVEAEEVAAAEVTLGPLADAGDRSDLDALAILGIVEDAEDELATALAEALPAWIEAGADLLADRLEDGDPVEASDEILALVEAAG